MSITTMNELINAVSRGRHVVVMRGVSGAGKSTVAKRLFDAVGGGDESFHAAIVSADTYFTDERGVYRFDPSLLGEAHASCLRAFVTLMESLGDEEDNALIIVDNTNISVAEAAPYMALAPAYGFSASLVTLDTPWNIAANRNIHGLDAPRVESMQRRMERERENIPHFWAHTMLARTETWQRGSVVPAVESSQEVR